MLDETDNIRFWRITSYLSPVWRCLVEKGLTGAFTSIEAVTAKTGSSDSLKSPPVLNWRHLGRSQITS